MTVITPQRSLMGTTSADMRQETDRMLTRLAQVTSQQGQSVGIPRRRRAYACAQRCDHQVHPAYQSDSTTLTQALCWWAAPDSGSNC